jgi:hypothetical protein
LFRTYIHTDLPWKRHRLIAVTAPTAMRAVRGVAVILILILILRGSRVAVYKSAELIDLGLKLRRRVDERLMAQEILDREGRHERKVDILAKGRQLVVGRHEAEQVQDHTRVAHVQAKSQVADSDRHTPLLRLCVNRTVTSRGERRITRLTLEDRLGYLLGEVAKRRLGTVTILVFRGDRRTRRFLRSRGGSECGRRNQRGHVRVVSLVRRRATALARSRSPIGNGKTCHRVRHDGVAVCVNRHEDVRSRESGSEGRSVADSERRHFVLERKGVYRNKPKKGVQFYTFFLFFFGFCFEESLLCDEEKAQRYTVPVHGALNGHPEALKHLFTGHTDGAVTRTA